MKTLLSVSPPGYSPLMRRLILFLFLGFGLTGCTKYVVRDTVTYQVELEQYDTWATRQAGLLREFVAEHCSCDAERKFTTTRCADAADFILTVESRHAWHKAMSLYLAGITDTRPPKEPPVIPESKTLCPVNEVAP